MVDENYKADSPDLELKSNIDESKLTDDEKKMLADLQSSRADKGVSPPAVANAQMEESLAKQVEPSTTVMEPVLSGKVAENIATPFPAADKISPEAAAIAPPPSTGSPPPSSIAEESQDVEDEKSDIGEDAYLENCPHCGWDLSKQSIPEPTDDEKMGFLHSVLGQKTFLQQYDLFGGKVIVRFRTLTTKEMDVIYNFVFKQRETGIITTIQDYWEKVNRYRLYLQLMHLSAIDGSFTHTLPDSYSRETNPYATEFWQFPAYDPDLGYLEQIEEKILKDVLRTETIQRTISTYCARFNRLVSKLEVMIDSPDFWNETEQQS